MATPTRKPIQYAVIDAFTGSPFKGNPAAVCLLEESEDDHHKRDEQWMQSLAMEFNISETCFLTPIAAAAAPRFRLRWFTPVAEVELCGHATLAASHFLFSSGLVEADAVEFVTLSGVLTAKRVRKSDRFLIELDFPALVVVECEKVEVPEIPITLGGASVVRVMRSSSNGSGDGDLIVELASGEAVAGIQPQLDEIRKCAGRGVIITGPAPSGSGFDFYTRFFCPKLGIDEDPVCGSAHCALAPYWSKKLGRKNLIAFMASPRSGILDLQLEEDTQRVLILGEATTVMVGSILV